MSRTERRHLSEGIPEIPSHEAQHDHSSLDATDGLKFRLGHRCSLYLQSGVELAILGGSVHNFITVKDTS